MVKIKIRAIHSPSGILDSEFYIDDRIFQNSSTYKNLFQDVDVYENRIFPIIISCASSIKLYCHEVENFFNDKNNIMEPSDIIDYIYIADYLGDEIILDHFIINIANILKKFDTRYSLSKYDDGAIIDAVTKNPSLRMNYIGSFYNRKLLGLSEKFGIIHPFIRSTIARYIKQGSISLFFDDTIIGWWHPECDKVHQLTVEERYSSMIEDFCLSDNYNFYLGLIDSIERSIIEDA